MPKVPIVNTMRSSELSAFEQVLRMVEEIEAEHRGALDDMVILEKSQSTDKEVAALETELFAWRAYEQFLKLRRAGRL